MHSTLNYLCVWNTVQYKQTFLPLFWHFGHNNFFFVIFPSHINYLDHHLFANFVVLYLDFKNNWFLYTQWIFHLLTWPLLRTTLQRLQLCTYSVGLIYKHWTCDIPTPARTTGCDFGQTLLWTPVRVSHSCVGCNAAATCRDNSDHSSDTHSPLQKKALIPAPSLGALRFRLSGALSDLQSNPSDGRSHQISSAKRGPGKVTSCCKIKWQNYWYLPNNTGVYSLCQRRTRRLKASGHTNDVEVRATVYSRCTS